jgi:hypothetical protein
MLTVAHGNAGVAGQLAHVDLTLLAGHDSQLPRPYDISDRLIVSHAASRLTGKPNRRRARHCVLSFALAVHGIR